MPSVVDILPDEILLKIFSYISIYDQLLSLSCVCRRWKNIVNAPILSQKFVFVCDYNKTTSETIRFLSQVPFLGHFHMECRYKKDDETSILNALYLHCKRVHSLILKNVSVNGYVLFRQVLQNLKELQVMHIDSAWPFFEAPVHEFPTAFGQSTYLKKLFLPSFKVLRSSHLRAIVDNCRFLEELDISSAWGISDADIVYLIEQRKDTLVNLKVYGSMLTDESFGKISKCRKLETLQIRCCQGMSSSSLNSMSALHLKSLALLQAVKIPSRDMSRLLKEGHAANLVYLDLSSCDLIDDQVAHSIAMHCTSLQSLSLVDCGGISDRGVKTILSGRKSLRRLVISRMYSLTGEFLSFIPIYGTSLKYLQIDKHLQNMLPYIEDNPEAFLNLKIEWV